VLFRSELIMIDDGGDPARAEAAARRLVEQDKVIAIFNDYMISEAPAVVRYLEQKNVPLITGACGCDAIFDTSSIVFNPIQGVSTGIANGFLVPPTKATDKKTVASLYCREATLCSVQEDLIRKRMAEGFGGLKLVYEAQVSLAQPDFTAEVLEAKRAGAEILECLVDIQSCMRIAQAAHRQGYKPIFAGNWNLQDDKNALAAAKDLEGMVVPSRVPNWQTSPRMQFYRDAMARYQPGQVMGDGGASAFVVGALLDKVVSTLPPNPSSADLIAGLLALRGETLGGLLPPITFPKSADRSSVNVCNIPTVLKGGKFSAIDPSEAFVCGL
jgi:branched-chain amino acid transport system substrate-binding protein